jgi:hypothetical protein
MSAESILWPAPRDRTNDRTVREFMTRLAFYGVLWIPWSVLRGGGALGGRVIGSAVFLFAMIVFEWSLTGLWRRKLRFPSPRRELSTNGTEGETRSFWNRRADVPWILATFAVVLGGTVAFGAKSSAPIASVVAAGMALAGFLWLVRHSWLGGLEVRWESATLRPGGRAVFHVAATDGSSRLLDAAFRLRCVGRDDCIPSTPWSPVRPVISTLWSVDPASVDGAAPGPGEFARVEFDVPCEALPSRISPALSVGWELLVHGRSTWGRVVEVFDVPVVAAAETEAEARDPAAAVA